MFPPSSPVTERLRAQSEFEELERQARFKAESQPLRRWSLATLLTRFTTRKPHTVPHDTAKRDLATACAEYPLKNT